MNWKALISSSDIPEDYKKKIALLVEKHGYQWMQDLLLSDSRKGDGTSKRGFAIEIDLSGFTNDLETTSVPSVDEIPDTRGLDFFLFDVEMNFDEEMNQDIDDFSEVLYDWISLRIDYLRSCEGKKTTWSRAQAYEEVTAVDCGGEELACVSCGSLFWDNLNRLKEAERFYCSMACQEKVETDCIFCGTHFIVGRAKLGFRNYYRLNGFCDVECYKGAWAKKTEDNRYVWGIKKRLQATGASVDESITRRAVFEKFGGVCYICGKQTHWQIEGSWDPLLANVDHIHPVSKGGSHTWENVALACHLCNIRKGAKEPQI
jgi:5-methylcytosine-specific restriction endonuclease McrA